jgi:hypothetical protein
MKITLGRMAMAWAHVALGLAIFGEATFIILGMRFVLPMCKRILTYVDTDVSGFYTFIPGATDFLGYCTQWRVARIPSIHS